MELVYLWVEKYKNIHRQGFNFSPRFECRFHDEYEKYTDESGEEKERLKDNCTLEIKDNPNHIENFFGKDINVTAIVGKNGSGKSSLLSILRYGINKYFDDNISENYFALLYFKKEKSYMIKGKYENISIDRKLDRNDLNRLYNIYYSQSIESYSDTGLDTKNYISENLANISDTYMFEKIVQEIKNTYSLEISSYLQLNGIYNNNHIFNGLLALYNRNLIFPNDFIIPTTVSLGLYYKDIRLAFERIMSEVNNNDREVLLKLTELYDLKYQYRVQQETWGFFQKEDWDYFIKFIAIINSIIIDSKNLKIIAGVFDDINSNLSSKKNIIDTILHAINESYLKEINRLIDTLKLLRGKHHPSIAYSFDIYENENILKNIINIYSEIMSKYSFNFLRFSFLKKLSGGEEKLFYLFSKLYMAIDKKKEFAINDTILIMLDEPDIYLHPRWHKKFITLILDFLTKNYTNLNFHIILTTNRPFYLSDIPKQNIIFLDTNEKGNCKVVDGLKDKKQTFGANIHTLLSDSFFMEDGLMGEFAKGKINEIIDFHKEVEKENAKETPNLTPLKEKYEDKQKHFRQTQSIIGEDYLKQIIKNHLIEIEKILLGKVAARQAEIERTEAYLESLKNG